MQQLIVFGEDWGAHPSSTQHLMKHLQQQYELVWVNSIGLRRPTFTVRDGKRLLAKAKSMLKKRPSAPPSVSRSEFPVVEPKVIPWPSSSVARKLNGALLKNLLSSFTSEDKRPILWTSLPSAVDVVGKLNEKAVIYYCGDDFTSLAGVDHAPVAVMEQELVEKADLVIVASQELAKKFPADKTVVLEHGVDYEEFSSASKYSAPRPEDLKMGRPIVGFYGSIADWIDVELIKSVAHKLPDWEFVFIGSVQTDISAIKELPNISLLGPKPHNELPNYVAHWQVSWLPFRQCGQIDACNPLKLREYLALGKPIVSSEFPALEPYKQLVNTATTAEEFVNAIEVAACDSPKLISEKAMVSEVQSWLDVEFLSSNTQLRRHSVSKESWRTKSEQVHQLITLLRP